MSNPITILVAARNRPIYLWACLDSFYRNTSYPHRFILLDMASDDPGVAPVIEGFRRRGMIEHVLTAPRNDPAFLTDVVIRHLDAWSPLFAYVEADVMVAEASPCWLEQMASLMHDHPNLAMLGSAIDKRDFIEPAQARALCDGIDPSRIDSLIKASSLERQQDVNQAAGAALFRPHNPAGRLMLLRTEAIRAVGPATDGTLDAKLRAAGYDTAIAACVQHRHLSLVQLYDYPEYDIAGRDAYMRDLDAVTPLP